ncbi:MAG: leucine-rich repeat domain-containing protein, partial [Muribaculaceae bacterium]|nr:leucine-rich repeat domain-containing protein [Muribaculaceae bacterium]
MKKVLLLMMAVATLALSSSAATKIYVCGTKITGTTSFNAGGGTVSYDNSTRTLTLYNVDYSKSGSSNNGISVDEVDGDLTINLNGTVKFTISDADAVLCKDKNKHTTYINVNKNATFTTKSSGHAGLKLQDCDVYLQGSGTLTINNTNSSSSANAIKGGTRSENLDFKIKNCTVESNGPRFYNLYEVTFRYTSYYDTGDYISRSTLITLKPGSSNTVHAKDVTSLNDYYTHIFLPIDYYSKNIYLLKESDLSGKEVQISDYVPAVKINASKFPDANLFNHLRYLEPQGWLTTSAMNAYTYLNISDLNISSLEGLSQFANLKELRCNNNNLTNLYDVPTSIQTLNCSNNKITSFNYLQNCSSLKTLNCSNNQISSLNNLPTNIESLDCSSNKFTSLNFDYMTSDGYHNGAKYTKLRSLNCSYNTQLTELYHNYWGTNNCVLTSLNVTGCSSLKMIVCPYNNISSLTSLPSSLKTLNLHANKFTSQPTLPSGLEMLQMSSNQLTSFAYYNSSYIKTIYIANNPLVATEVGNNSNLTNFYIYSSPSLKMLTCYENSSLKSIDLDDCTSLMTLNCYNNSSLEYFSNLGDCTALTKIDCHNNKLSSLDVSNLSNLIELNCCWNKIGSLDVSNKTKLTRLEAHYNQLTSLNVQGCSSLNYLMLESNKLTSLSVQGCNALRTINCCLNKINELGANTLINSLCTIPAGSYGSLRYIYPGYSSGSYVENNVNLTNAQVISARNKRWIPSKFVSGSGWVDIPFSTAVPGDVNGDGVVTAADVTALYDFMLNNDTTHLVNGDQTGDGEITAADVTAVYTIML